ncbi:TerC/Alx family metal homeostasis membrane protein [Salinisphaera sp.]|uniref:TerC/Alx family metal homeostasis membrane protein n=1 Tax=Salinisphaera sp. TaxID=1914330 RepID=UPI002D76B9D2|nr:TerC/Alx family metal homeostasis membrane protein [Salinisphaera sp.]HET7313398.1 TerC/Alx family metal homeostasis membrane protein [Salinisphaera sp.]
MDVPAWVWIATIAGIGALFIFDFVAHVRKPHEPSLTEAGSWTAFYVVTALIFGAGLWFVWGHSHGIEYLAGYITEMSLSVDNLFVFVIIMGSFEVPRAYQQKVLLVGVLIALILRAIFIIIGAAAIAHFSWVFYIFGAFLLYTAYSLATASHDENEEYQPNILVRLTQKYLPATDEYNGARLTIMKNGKRLITPMLIVMVAIGATDILFALDSIPAIYGLTNEPYIVFTANAFALLGLIQLYYLLGGLLDRLVYLSFGLAVILGFIGIKLILEALHGNELPFINGGHPIKAVPEIPIWLSLAIIIGVLAVTTVASLIKSSRSG